VPELIVHDPVLVRKEMSDLQDLLDLPPRVSSNALSDLIVGFSAMKS
jgi:hypothetical protein